MLRLNFDVKNIIWPILLIKIIRNFATAWGEREYDEVSRRRDEAVKQRCP